MHKPLYFIMVGLPASGKSTIAKEIVESINEETVICSSDHMRELIYGENYDKDGVDIDNNLVFSELYKEVRMNLKAKKNVILDATNITIKDRKKAIEAVRKIPCYKIAYIVVKKHSQCVKDDKNRNHSVGEKVIDKFIKRFEIPLMGEGFDFISIYQTEGFDKKFNKNKRNKILEDMKNFDQKNPNHSKTLGLHSLSVADCFKNENKFWQEVSIWHDIGKLFTQTFDEKLVAHYYNHQNVGAYYLLSNYDISIYDLEDKQEALLFLVLVQAVNYHMVFMNELGIKAEIKWINLLGNLYENLKIFNEIDKECK